MSYAVPFSLLSFHLPDRDDSAEERLTWPLAGSLVIHVVVFIAFLSLRFTSSLEQSSGSYEVTLVTLPEIVSSPTAPSANKSRPEQNADKVPPPPKAAEAPKAAPPRKAVSSPSPVPQEKPRVPELVTDSLMSALDSVVVPKPQVPALPQKADPVPAPASPPAPIRQPPASEMNVQPIQAPPEPPKLAPGPVTGKTETPTPDPSVDLLAKELKQAVGAIVVPKNPNQASSRVTVTADDKRKQDPTKTPRSSGITLPSRAPRLADVSPPEAPKKETPLQSARNSSTVESLTQAIQSVRVPEIVRKSKTPQPVSEAVPLVRERSPKHPNPDQARHVPPTIVPPQAPQLTEVPVEQDPVSAQSTVPKTTPEPDILGSQIAKLAIPEVPAFDAQPGSEQVESRSHETPGLLVAGSCSPQNPYWKKINNKIDKIHEKNYWYTHRVESPAVLTFRVERNGQVADLAVFQSSGNEKFDLAAKRAVLAAVPLPPFPTNMPKPFCQVQHTFKSLNR